MEETNKCFRQWKIFWTILFIILSVIVALNTLKLGFKMMEITLTVERAHDGGITRLILDDGYTMIGTVIHDFIIGLFISLIVTAVSLGIIWGIRWWIIYGGEEAQLKNSASQSLTGEPNYRKKKGSQMNKTKR